MDQVAFTGALGAVDWSAADVQSLQQTLGLSFSAVLVQLKLNVVEITHLRSGAVIAMAVVIAVSHHAQVSHATAPKRHIVFRQGTRKKAPIVTVETLAERSKHVPLLDSPHESGVNATVERVSFHRKRTRSYEQQAVYHVMPHSKK